MLGCLVVVRRLAPGSLKTEVERGPLAPRRREPPAEAVVPARIREPEPELRGADEAVSQQREAVTQPRIEPSALRRVLVVFGVVRRAGSTPIGALTF